MDEGSRLVNTTIGRINQNRLICEIRRRVSLVIDRYFLILVLGRVMAWIGRKWWLQREIVCAQMVLASALITPLYLLMSQGFLWLLPENSYHWSWLVACVINAGLMVRISYRLQPYIGAEGYRGCSRCNTAHQEPVQINTSFQWNQESAESYPGCVLCGKEIGLFKHRAPTWVGLHIDHVLQDYYALNTPEQVQRFMEDVRLNPKGDGFKGLYIHRGKGEQVLIHLEGSDLWIPESLQAIGM